MAARVIFLVTMSPSRCERNKLAFPLTPPKSHDADLTGIVPFDDEHFLRPIHIQPVGQDLSIIRKRLNGDQFQRLVADLERAIFSGMFRKTAMHLSAFCSTAHHSD